MEINGKEIKLYYPNGDTFTTLDEFIDFYSKCYYIDNNKEVEDKIEEILKNGIQSPVELFRVLAWKFGRIDMKKSTGNAFVYTEKMNEETMKLRIFHKDEIMGIADINELYKIIEKHTGNCDTVDKAREFLIDIRNFTNGKNWEKHFYSVYIITLLYFVSKAEYPIVDSFAYVGLDAIFTPIDYGKRIYSPRFVQPYDLEFEEIVTNGAYKEYIDRFNNFVKLLKDPDLRKVDQALWMYGKLFKKP